MVIDWVTQIILFILLATIIDLVIPATSMKKYIKLVVGFILILILLKPLFFIFQIDVQRALETSLSGVLQEINQNDALDKSIETQKNEIEDTQDAYILEQMAVQLKEIAKEPLQDKFQAEITDIQFRFADEREKTYENLDEVIVYVNESKDGEGAVRIVDDVVIDLDSPEQSREDNKLQDIEATLNDLWEIEQKKLLLQWEGDLDRKIKETISKGWEKTT
ncbi:stage III sporulation protein AF [Virgibacillus pantothenticus]|uniref:stage III sporulation protein AF n=1 Tax=Virgibacillus pantothenticus TaxID=1473 RepID=UPI0020B40DEF|nr:stage III sporulation protein AF [Virgibacillus pantothenticus]MEB5451532.1 stage III sporulation protein AF [Virgibacillus pantothenticus]MEB5455558.1 stage III sporulation protein AF [Virgibacillus pantothenticus]MEB5459401.1 stage III sporulation protein AF [Virgibacillus pantothenticus]MEB5463865.1 stage III sporulation protein AF [Virgibacillus pantothenticus]MEB5467638.1 stage III sporulation protein AF [Virgibacillus pantothenticus]